VDLTTSAVPGPGAQVPGRVGGTPGSIALSFSSDESFSAAPRGTTRKTRRAFASDDEEAPQGSRRSPPGAGGGPDLGAVGLAGCAPRRRNAGRGLVPSEEGSSSEVDDSPVVAQSTLRKAHRYVWMGGGGGGGRDRHGTMRTRDCDSANKVYIHHATSPGHVGIKWPPLLRY